MISWRRTKQQVFAMFLMSSQMVLAKRRRRPTMLQEKPGDEA
ncbi:hypothetical protein RTCIAT899_PC01095 (plasmid) [Rhizobium tropici CIAT 899]|nr:hypothetical protein RTCIAT899_PC01095 [Rhizobium tropici CIAT 899]